MAIEAVIVDIDGTIAEFSPEKTSQWVLGTEKDWSPFFEYMKNADTIDDVVKLVKLLHLQGQKILICSGRSDTYRQSTIDWLEVKGIPFDAIYLRPKESDHVSDEQVKENLLKEIRQDHFNPWLVLDDRKAVVDRWRELGMTCLQCAPGDF